MTQTLSPDARLALVMHENLAQGFGKMGFGMLRYSQQDIVAVLDRQTAGQDLVALTGIPRPTPIVATIAEAIALGADTLVLGVANPGGVLPSDWWAELKEGLAMGMSLVNGLHNPLAENPELKPLLQPGRFIWDVRREPEGLVNGTGRARETTAKRILCVGTDMSIGKMTAALELDRVARARGLRSKFLASGQTGICIAGDGVPLDAVRVDFASGAMEQLVLRYGFDHDLLFIEGQGSLLHPASTAWLPLVRGTVPTHLILCHRAGQEIVYRVPWARIPPLREVVASYEAVCTAGGTFPPARVVGIALITAHLNEAEARQALAETEAATGLPATDVVRFGSDALLDAVLAP
jgi:uncharacterized NAD-dependent epimerase/dehydratase family protein